jgi:hypothetical protein
MPLVAADLSGGIRGTSVAADSSGGIGGTCYFSSCFWGRCLWWSLTCPVIPGAFAISPFVFGPLPLVPADLSNTSRTKHTCMNVRSATHKYPAMLRMVVWEEIIKSQIRRASVDISSTSRRARRNKTHREQVHTGALRTALAKAKQIIVMLLQQKTYTRRKHRAGSGTNAVLVGIGSMSTAKQSGGKRPIQTAVIKQRQLSLHKHGLRW